MSQLSILFKDRILSIHQLNQQSDFVIGSSTDCNIHIDSLAVNPKHAKISYSDRSYSIEELDSDSNFLINNKKADSGATLSDGDHISIGKHMLIFTFDERNEKDQIREPEVSPFKGQKAGWVQYLNGSNMGKTMQIKQNMANIADEKEENIALISNRADGFYISYLKGKEPPKVNNASIGEKSLQLESNSSISVGALNLLFYIE